MLLGRSISTAGWSMSQQVREVCLVVTPFNYANY